VSSKKSFRYERYDLEPNRDYNGEYLDGLAETPDPQGDWVKAQDALDREAVLQAQIRTLETQLKEARATLETLRPVWAAGAAGPQVTAVALAAVWRALGVSDQTAAMQKLRERAEYKPAGASWDGKIMYVRVQ
jgi:protein involved in temperature-dependent protein secretion